MKEETGKGLDSEDTILPQRSTREEIIESPKTHLVLDKEFVGSMKGATPDVKDVKYFRGTNTAPATVTQFINGQQGQTIKILGDGQMTITNGANIKTNTAANKLLAVNKIYTFTKIIVRNTSGVITSNVWYENE